MKKTPDSKVYASISIRLTDPGSARLVTERCDEYLIYGHQGKPVILTSAVADVPESSLTDPDTEEHQLPDLHHGTAAEE